MTENFRRAEFACPCCGLAPIDLRVVENLQILRNLVGSPLVVSSGFRCWRHNGRLPGASPTSQHLVALAVDILPPFGTSTSDLFSLAKRLGIFKGLGLYNGHVHLDLRDGPPTEWDLRS